MHLKSLKVFCDVVGRRSFSRAAAENGISQSGASQIVNAPGRAPGREADRPHQAAVRAHARRRGLLRGLPQARPAVLCPGRRGPHAARRGRRPRERRLDLFDRPVAHEPLRAAVPAGAIRRRTCGCSISIRDRVYELVESDQVDLGLVSFPRSSRTIKATVWREEPMVLVCAPQHRAGGARAGGAGRSARPGDDRLRCRPGNSPRDRSGACGARRRSPRGDGVRQYRNDQAGGRDRRRREPAARSRRSIAKLRPGRWSPGRLAGVELKRPIGIIQRRGKELGKTARRFMQLLLKQSALVPSESREIAAAGRCRLRRAGARTAAAPDSEPRSPRSRTHRPPQNSAPAGEIARFGGAGRFVDPAARWHSALVRGDHATGVVAMTIEIENGLPEEARAVRPGVREG